MSAQAVAPILAADAEETLTVAAPTPPVESSAIVDGNTWRAVIVAAMIIVFCLIACFALMNWMCCVG